MAKWGNLDLIYADKGSFKIKAIMTLQKHKVLGGISCYIVKCLGSTNVPATFLSRNIKTEQKMLPIEFVSTSASGISSKCPYTTLGVVHR